MLKNRKTFATAIIAALATLTAAQSQAAPTCPTRTISAGNYSYTIYHGGRFRSYRLHIPSGLTTPAAVVLSLHGLSSSSTSQQSNSGWDTTSNANRNFVVAYPNGVSNAWNVAGFNPSVDDTGFMKAIVDHLSARVRIAPNRVYISGTSLGGGFSHKMACTQANYFAAATPLVFHLHSSPQDYVCAPSRPIGVQEYAGLDDTLVRYEGGTSTVLGRTVTHLSANASFEKWAQMSGCTGTPVTTWSSGRSNIKQYQTCGGGVIVGLASLNCGHGYCTSSSLGSPTADMWRFLSRHTTPGLKTDACAP